MKIPENIMTLHMMARDGDTRARDLRDKLLNAMPKISISDLDAQAGAPAHLGQSRTKILHQAIQDTFARPSIREGLAEGLLESLQELTRKTKYVQSLAIDTGATHDDIVNAISTLAEMNLAISDSVQRLLGLEIADMKIVSEPETISLESGQ